MNTTNGRDTASLVLAVPAVQNPELLEAQQGVSTTAEVANPELVRARKYAQ